MEIDWEEFAKDVGGPVLDVLKDELSAAIDLGEHAVEELRPVAEKITAYWRAEQEGDQNAARLREHAEATVKLVVALYALKGHARAQATARRIVGEVASIGLALLKVLMKAAI